MDALNDYLSKLAHNYLLIAAAAVVWFAVKAVTGYITYKHYNKKFKELNQKLNQLMNMKK